MSQLLKGKVVSNDGKSTVPFAIVSIDQSNKGTTTDIDGNFNILLNGTETELNVQVLGYHSAKIKLSSINVNELLLIKLKPNSIELLEIVITPKENPAIPIIKNVIENKAKHDIANINYYLCNTYAKTYFTLSDKNGDEFFYNKDTIKFKKLKKFLEKSYFFFMESVTEKKYIYKNKTQEKVLSSRVSGFKSAPFGSFASQLQSFTFYNDNIELLGIKYVSPVIPGTFKRYLFEITDTVYSGIDTTILIRFSPKKNAKFKAMKGVLYINKNDYAICNVLAEPSEMEKDGTGIKIQQLYEKVDSLKWFPVQANTEILFNSMNMSSGTPGSENNPIMKGVSRVYIKDIKLDSVIKIKNKSIASYNAEDFDKKKDDFWELHRKDSLNVKEQKTYHLVDSIGKEAKLEEKLKWMTALASNKWNIGYFDIDLQHILRVNDYEMIRAGLGMSTSNKLTRWMSIGGYGAYGFKDKGFKYGGHTRINFNYRQTNYLLAEMASDVVETGGTFFLNEGNGFISTSKLRELLISNMDKVNYGKLSVNTTLFNQIKSSVYLKVEQRNSAYGYYLEPEAEQKTESRDFTMNEVGLQFRYWPKEKYIESLGQLMSSGSKWPLFYINLSKGITDQIDVYKGDFDYTKIDLRIDQQINFKIKGFLSYQIQAGKILGDVPYSIQYNNKGSRVDKYSLSIEKTFETMYLNEFISTEYAALFVAVNFGKLIKVNKKFNPELELVHNYGIGNLSNRQNITNIELNDMSKGYTEAGIRIKNLLRSNFSTFGVGAFYRYGNYSYENTKQNLTFKLVLGFAL